MKIGRGKLTGFNAGGALQNRAEGELATARQRLVDGGGGQHGIPALTLRKGGGGIGRGETVEIHGRISAAGDKRRGWGGGGNEPSPTGYVGVWD